MSETERERGSAFTQPIEIYASVYACMYVWEIYKIYMNCNRVPGTLLCVCVHKGVVPKGGVAAEVEAGKKEDSWTENETETKNF